MYVIVESCHSSHSRGAEVGVAQAKRRFSWLWGYPLSTVYMYECKISTAKVKICNKVPWV